MVKVYGNVKPEDDYTHPLGPEENFNESVYFNCSGATTHIGEGMTEYVLDGERVGYGLSEYLDQPED